MAGWLAGWLAGGRAGRPGEEEGEWHGCIAKKQKKKKLGVGAKLRRNTVQVSRTLLVDACRYNFVFSQAIFCMYNDGN